MSTPALQNLHIDLLKSTDVSAKEINKLVMYWWMCHTCSIKVGGVRFCFNYSLMFSNWIFVTQNKLLIWNLLFTFSVFQRSSVLWLEQWLSCCECWVLPTSRRNGQCLDAVILLTFLPLPWNVDVLTCSIFCPMNKTKSF